MEKIKKYAVITLTVFLVLALITAGVMGFMWGKASAENRDLKEAKKEYLASKAEQDSLIQASQERVEILTDSVSILTEEAEAINRIADSRLYNVRKSNKDLYEEIRSVNNLSTDSQLRLFAKQSREYKPK